MKCNKCLFSKEINSQSCKCMNINSDWNGSRLFLKWDGCMDGKSSTFGMSRQELMMLQLSMSQEKENK